ncbi:hypothetical protein TKK_0011021 [Trichogramma kaykai]|uniref:LITAF domain-containing protein n=1 Tax=Trichogramma kaykai TaxID=54128 RepID=A0ABD2WU82_9HYME
MAIEKSQELAEDLQRDSGSEAIFTDRASTPEHPDYDRYQPKSNKSILFLREHTYLRREPAQLTCPNCLRGVETIVERHNNSTTHLSALLLLPVCLCVLPYCSKVLRDAIHRCPSCGIHLGGKFSSAREAFVICLQQPEDNIDRPEARFF